MHIFSCVDCGAAISVPADDTGKDVICENCNTRQAIPALTAETPPRMVVGNGETPPDYQWAHFTGALLIVLGILAIGISLFAFGAISGSVLLPVAIACNGLVLAAIGQILLLARVAARNTRRQGQAAD